jgi:CRISPR-associated protein Csd1
MSWLTELEALYDAVQNSTSIDGGNLLPIYHICNNACVTVLLDGRGNFITAESVDKKAKDRQTCMPCTETCAARTSGDAAYPLCDKLEYVAGDYAPYVSSEKQWKKDKKHEMYVHDLGLWCSSSFGTEITKAKIKAVYTYVQKNTLMSDLKNAGIFTEDGSDGTQKAADLSDFVRWQVEIPGDTHSDLWTDKDVQESWIAYYDSFSDRKTGLCYADGREEKIADLHPAKIRNSGDKAKIISANDDTNYTFRGRFTSSGQACQISSLATQKAHNALRWVIGEQGERFSDGLTVVTWNRAGKKLPFLGESSLDLEKEDIGETSTMYQTAQAFAESMNKRLTGYYGDGKEQNTRCIMLMVLNAATPGRMSILQYRELERADLIKNLDHWYGNLVWHTCYWQSDDPADRKNKKGSYMYTIGTPSPKTIAQTAYGEHVRDELIGKTVQRILPCITDSQPVPSDIETQCVKSASNLFVIDSYGKREQVLCTACAVYKYNQFTRYKEEFKLALEEDRKDRDYLYGRLLAAAQQLENAALRKMDADRETNAVRYMQRFALFPAETWRMLYEKKLPAYRRHLEPGLAAWFEQKIQDITALFKTEDFMSNKPLTGEYLLGYQCQLKDFRKKNASADESEMVKNN